MLCLLPVGYACLFLSKLCSLSRVNAVFCSTLCWLILYSNTRDETFMASNIFFVTRKLLVRQT